MNFELFIATVFMSGLIAISTLPFVLLIIEKISNGLNDDIEKLLVILSFIGLLIISFITWMWMRDTPFFITLPKDEVQLAIFIVAFEVGVAIFFYVIINTINSFILLWIIFMMFLLQACMLAIDVFRELI